MKLALAATAVALVLGTCLSFALHRYKFFGRNSLSFLIVLPIALPGIVTGVALRNTFIRLGWDLGFTTVVIGHGTFCIVLAFNNVVARLRRLSPNVQEASADLGASGWQTFRHVTFPLIRSALLAGGLLAFAPELRRDRRHHLHRRRRDRDLAAVDPQQLRPAEQRADVTSWPRS